MTFRLTLLPLLALALAACADDAASGPATLDLRGWGEDFIEVGIPAAETADGWTITFTSVVPTLQDVTVAGTVVVPNPRAPELVVPTEGAGVALGEFSVPSGVHEDLRFGIDRLQVSGSADHADGRSVAFDWTFDTPVAWSRCEDPLDLPGDTRSTLVLTFHGDHLFFDSLVAEEPAIRFERLALADTDGDGTITAAELAQADIGDYDPGSAGGIDNLWQWLEAQARLVGHVNGEGHCELVQPSR
jgi:hypothetical protein